MRNRVIIAALAAAAVAVGAGCGSSNSTLSYSSFSAQANTICQDGTNAVKALPPKSSPQTFAKTIQPFVDKMKALKAPDELKTAQTDFVNISQQQIDAANTGDVKKLQSLSAASDAAGSKMGAKACASTGG